MKLRIVMPVLNEGESLALRLRALQPLRARGAEVVVVDGGSTDTTWALATALADQVRLAPRGRAAQMNAGAKDDGGEGGDARQPFDTLLFLHADTQLPDGADALIDRALQGRHHWGRFDVHISGRHRLLPMVATLMNWRSRLSGMATGDQALFVRRSVFEAAGGFADQPLMEDLELSQRLKQIGRPACLPERVITSGRRWDTHGLWRTVGLMWRLRAAYFFGADPAELARRYGYAPQPSVAPAALAVLAKAPVPGLAKTRLIPALGANGQQLGAAGAARVQRGFARRTLHKAQAVAGADVTLWCAPDPSHRFFRALQRTTGVVCHAQPVADLGARMQAAFTHHFAASSSMPLLLIGTDCPVMAPGHLQAAARALETHDVVLIPAEDGGYVLIGMRRAVPEAFADMTWSTPQVLADTRLRLKTAGATWHELPTLWDVDEPADWARLQALTAAAAPTVAA